MVRVSLAALAFPGESNLVTRATGLIAHATRYSSANYASISRASAAKKLGEESVPMGIFSIQFYERCCEIANAPMMRLDDGALLYFLFLFVLIVIICQRSHASF